MGNAAVPSIEMLVGVKECLSRGRLVFDVYEVEMGQFDDVFSVDWNLLTSNNL